MEVGETSAALVVAVVAVRLIVALMLKFALLSRDLKTSAATRALHDAKGHP